MWARNPNVQATLINHNFNVDSVNAHGNAIYRLEVGFRVDWWCYAMITNKFTREAFNRLIADQDLPPEYVRVAEFYFMQGWNGAVDLMSDEFLDQWIINGTENQLIRKEEQEPYPDDDREWMVSTMFSKPKRV